MSIRYKIFIFIEVLLYLVFMYVDIVNSNIYFTGNDFTDYLNKSYFLSTAQLKYYSMLLCLAIAVINLCKKKNQAAVLLTSALGFTVVADFFLLLHPDILLPGIAAFCIVHFIYLLVITGGSIKKAVIPLLIRLILSILLTVTVIKIGLVSVPKDSNLSAVVFLAFLYASSFLGNIIRIVISKRDCVFTHPSLFILGLVLFLLCDINVLIFNLDGYVNISSKAFDILKNISQLLMWGFYLPSQVLIVLSAS